ncbi:MAG: sterol desaturase family protein [Myxococcota bacterium]|nr:sterol desaturase family protein [Myxococcota bacterium]
MDLNPIGLALPVFTGLMVVEFVVARIRGRRVYRFNDAVGDLTCGMGDQVLNLVTSIGAVAAYQWVQVHAGAFTFSLSDPWVWAFGLVAVDALYYVFHRFSHRVNLGWMSHVVHHQSEEYNLAVALRQPWFAQFISWAVYLPLALIGLPAEVWLLSYAANLMYQFWIHTQLIGTLGPLEWVMNTPSHHRVHHGTNPEYIDKNYAGIFIVWDRMFGTFAKEEAPPVYGVMKPLRSWNPVVANVGPVAALVRQSVKETRGLDRLRVWWSEPGWTPEGVRPSSFPAPGRGYDANHMSGALRSAYIAGHLGAVSVVTALVITFSKVASPLWLGFGALYIAWSAVNWAGLFEARRWAVPSEGLRLVAVGTIASALAVSSAAGLASAGLWGLATLSLISLPVLVAGRPVASAS